MRKSDMPDVLQAILDAPDGPDVVAFFDFDGTLIDGYSAMAFYQNRLRQREVGLAEVLSVLTLGLRGNMTGDEFAELAGKSLRTWEGRSIDQLEELGER